MREKKKKNHKNVRRRRIIGKSKRAENVWKEKEEQAPICEGVRRRKSIGEGVK